MYKSESRIWKSILGYRYSWEVRESATDQWVAGWFGWARTLESAEDVCFRSIGRYCERKEVY